MIQPKRGGQNGKPAPKRQGAVLFRRYITLKNGRVLDAHDYGLKAWPISFKK